jgi:hypothetical protein
MVDYIPSDELILEIHVAIAPGFLYIPPMNDFD